MIANHNILQAAVGVDYLPAERPQQPTREPYQPFPVDVLPPVMRRYVVEQADAIGCDPAYVALPLLAALAAAVGNSRVLGLKRSWREVIVLWCVVVGDSGTMKSPAFDAAVYFTRRRENTAAKQYDADLAAYLEAKSEYDEALKAWKRAKPTERGERPEAPAAPSCARYVTADATNEALAPLLLHNRRGLLLARDELAGWLGGFNQYKAGKGSDVPNTLEMHRAGTMTTDRKTGDMTTIRVRRASLCIAGGIQPKALARSLTADFFDNGLAARLLLAMPPKRRKRWTEADVEDSTIAAVGRVFDELFDLPPDTDADGEPTPAVVTFDELAKDDWITFYNRHAMEQHEMDGDLSAAWSKLEGYAARLALVIHCVRQADGDSVRPLIMDVQSMTAGIRLAIGSVRKPAAFTPCWAKPKNSGRTTNWST